MEIHARERRGVSRTAEYGGGGAVSGVGGSVAVSDRSLTFHLSVFVSALDGGVCPDALEVLLDLLMLDMHGIDEES